jgi:hypothetical protein
MKMGSICSTQSSVLNQATLRNNPEDGRIQFNHSGSQGFRTQYILWYRTVPCDRTIGILRINCMQVWSYHFNWSAVQFIFHENYPVSYLTMLVFCGPVSPSLTAQREVPGIFNVSKVRAGRMYINVRVCLEDLILYSFIKREIFVLILRTGQWSSWVIPGTSTKLLVNKSNDLEDCYNLFSLSWWPIICDYVVMIDRPVLQ